MIPQLERVSYSSLSTLSCPYQNFLRYEGHVKIKQTFQLVLGTAVHEALEQSYSQPLSEDWTEPYVLTSTVDQAIARFQHIYEKLLEEEEVFITYPQLKKSQAEGAEMIALYFSQPVEGDIIAIEYEFSLPIAGIFIVGKMDRVRRTSKGLAVDDFKTGKGKPDTWFLRHNYQFTAYSLACLELFGELPYEANWHHLRTGQLFTTERDVWDFEQLSRLVEGAVKMKQEDIRFRIYSSKLCEYCDYSGYASYSTVHGGQCDDKQLEEEILARRNS